MATPEIVVNEYLGAELRRKYASWQEKGLVVCENTQAFKAKSQRPDLIICDNAMAPVGIETEFFPATTVESDAASRLGQVYVATGGKIHSVIAVRLPARYRTLSGTAISENLSKEEGFQYCLLSGDSATNYRRWPSAGYMTGSVTDLAYVVTTAKVSPVTVIEGAAVLEEGARVLAAMLGNAAARNAQLGSRIGDQLKQDPGAQTFAMAATVLINAFVFQETLAGTSKTLAQIKSIYAWSSGGALPTKMEVMSEWGKILEVNYWPIFGLSKALIACVPSEIWTAFVKACLETADRLLSLNLGKNADLVGTIFQRLISDRRFLATFYTAPASAALLASLMITSKLSTGEDWSDSESVRALRIADFACGTGTLLCSLYAELRTRMENAGLDSRALHSSLVENALVGCDVIPSATYITASQLSSVFPTIQYVNTKILTMPFGRQQDGSVALGALDLLETQGTISTISTRAAGVGAHSETEVDSWAALGGTAVKDQSFDFIAMNPPFTRLTGGGGKTFKVSRPFFAAFGITQIDQQAMAKRADKLFKGSAYHGNAGVASAFADIAHRKVKDEGRIGLILPLSALSGSSWEACRALWRQHYRGIVTLSIASQEAGASAFSADTGVAECMIVGTRSKVPGNRLVSVSLYRRPASNLEGAEFARVLKSLVNADAIRAIEDGPLGGTSILIGDEKVGEAVTAPVEGGPWPLFRIHDHSVAQAAYQLASRHCVWLPGATRSQLASGAFCLLGNLGEVGPYHLDLSGAGQSGGSPRGPFKLVKTAVPQSVTFPALVAHDEQRERYLEIAPDSEGLPRHVTSARERAILDRKRQTIWNTRTKLHFSTDTRFNANALIASLTTREAIGGRAWPSFILSNRQYEKTVAIWFNSTLGVLAYWWLSSKSQDGRGSVTTTRLQDLVCFDPRSLSDTDLMKVESFFEEFKSKALLDIHQCDRDANRSKIDEFVVRNLLKARSKTAEVEDGIRLIRAKLVLEPTISGGQA